MFKDIPKFVINLDRRKDRLELFDKEMKYIGWKYERFDAIDTQSYIGCALSFETLCRMSLEKQYEYIIIFEDDIFFMPYVKDIIDELEHEIFNVTTNWDIFHFGPSLHRPVASYNDILLDLTNTPPKDQLKHKGIYGTSGFVLKTKALRYFIEWGTNKYINNSHRHKAIDVFLDEGVYPVLQSFCYRLPIVVQRNDLSDINKTFDRNHYIMTYNWNVYCPVYLDIKYQDYDYCLSLKKYEN